MGCALARSAERPTQYEVATLDRSARESDLDDIALAEQ
jgi:hypothetical protein